MMLATMSAEPFALYNTTWWTYIGCGVLVLVLLWWGIRSWRFTFQALVLTMVAAGAFSFTQVPDAETYAPAAIAFILELEIEGSAGEIHYLSHITLVWGVLLALVLGSRLGWDYYRQRQQGVSSEKIDPQDSSSSNQA